MLEEEKSNNTKKTNTKNTKINLDLLNCNEIVNTSGIISEARRDEFTDI